MFDWTFHLGDLIIAASLLLAWLTYRNDQAKRHEENVSRLARIEADLNVLMDFYRNWIKDFFKREP